MKKHYPVHEIAGMVGVTPPTIYAWIRQGLPFRTEKIIGLRPRKIVSPADIEAFLKTKCPE